MADDSQNTKLLQPREGARHDFDLDRESLPGADEDSIMKPALIAQERS